jgi:hypothetical protein
MSDWQEIGRRVRDQIISENQNFNAKRRAQELIAIGERLDYASYRAPLIKSLLLNRPISPADRERFSALESSGAPSPPPKRGRGRPRDENVRAAATLATRLYRQWKDENVREGIKDWGLGGKMKEQSCHYAIEILKPLIERIGEPPEYDVVREMMERAIYRQK